MTGFLRTFFDRLAERRRRAKGCVDLNLLGFTSHRWRKTKSMRWDAVRQIDVGRKPTIGVDIFYAVLFDDNDSAVVDDMDAGFAEFEAAVFERWPEIKTAWIHVFTGSPDIEEYVTLWKRRESY